MLNNIFLFVVLNCRTAEAKITNNIKNQIDGHKKVRSYSFKAYGCLFVCFHMNIFLFLVALPVLPKVIEIDVAVHRLSL